MTSSEGFVPMPDGVRLYYRTIGRGPEVVIPNGLCFIDDFMCLADEFTLIPYDLRNRGQSEQSREGANSRGDIQLDAEDLDAMRRHFGIERMNLIGHSYIGLLVALYALRFPENANRVVQIGPMEPEPGKSYPAHMSWVDGVMQEVLAQMGPLYAQAASMDPVELCRKAWSMLGRIYVANPADAARINWGRCELPNERSFLAYWQSNVLPSIQRLNLAADLGNVKAKVLTIHGRRDRNAAYGGGRQWAMMLPDARLLTIEEGAHGPWIEAPDRVFGGIRTFLRGEWPEQAEIVAVLDPGDGAR